MESLGEVSLDANSCAILFPDFYVSENGALIIHHQRALADLLQAGAKRLIYVVGIEQVSPTMNEAETMLSLLARQGEALEDFSRIHFTFGQKNGREQHGPVEVYVVMLDQGRSDLLAEIPQRQALYCIHCGACAKYSNFEGTTTVIDRIKKPFTEGASHFSDDFMLPLSGKATNACPVGIDLKGLILENRRMAVEQKQDGRSDNLAWKAWKTAMMSRKWLNKGASMKNFTLKSFYKKYWGDQREFPKVADKSFNEWWLETRGKSEI
ncbi:MAG: LUD domain-containing protein [Bacteroidota bacterium]|nr:LUD domain-containing protein [Bacteroidota bacterium]MDX5431757.1 LUD domain-containing protein [Bacteroidota bacterium]MDX5470472.1 LUD domain-containing protein [Bacteroidota bacterium]